MLCLKCSVAAWNNGQGAYNGQGSTMGRARQDLILAGRCSEDIDGVHTISKAYMNQIVSQISGKWRMAARQ